MVLLGDIEYLRDLPHDYLLRDGGTETIDGRAARVLSLKPKRARRARAFRVVAYLADRASVAFDEESLFPVRLTFSPSPSSQTAQLLGPEGRVTVQYSGLRLTTEAALPFAPPEGTRVFREKAIALADLAEDVPFPFAVAALRDAGFEAIDGATRVVADVENHRGYCVTTFLRDGAEPGEASQLLTVRAGNYLSRNMARRRLTASEAGEETTFGGQDARFLDRRPLWEEQAAGIDTDRAPRELTWERDGTFWCLIGVQIDRSALTELASGLIEPAAPQSDDAEDSES